MTALRWPVPDSLDLTLVAATLVTLDAVREGVTHPLLGEGDLRELTLRLDERTLFDDPGPLDLDPEGLDRLALCLAHVRGLLAARVRLPQLMPDHLAALTPDLITRALAQVLRERERPELKIVTA